MAQIICLLFAIAISIKISVSTQCSYEKCPDPWNPDVLNEHTMCLYSATEFGDLCNSGKLRPMIGIDRDEILNRHNELRAQVAAGKETRGINGGQPAGNIGPLVWDNELATIAQRWANQCKHGHDKCRNIRGERIGQNVGYHGMSDTFHGGFVEIVTSWYDEVAKFDFESVPNYSPSRYVTQHYTQLIWANTTRVGCGGIKFLSTTNFYTFLLVCNYSPGGNMIGDAVYKLDHDSGRKLSDESDLFIPPELTNKETDQSKIETPSNFPTWQTQETPTRYVPKRTHVKSHYEKNIKDIQNYNSEQPVQIPPQVGQRCKYPKCTNPTVPGQYFEHTMCRYPNNRLGEQCTDVETSSLDPSEKKAILVAHNEERKRWIAESGRKGLRSLQWSEKLANIAQRWANQCDYFEDECRNIRGIEVGQNIGQMHGPDEFPQFISIVEAWYYALKNNRDYPYLGWANTTNVGCGGIKYKKPNGLRTTYLVCNYMSK